MIGHIWILPAANLVDKYKFRGTQQQLGIAAPHRGVVLDLAELPPPSCRGHRRQMRRPCRPSSPCPSRRWASAIAAAAPHSCIGRPFTGTGRTFTGRLSAAVISSSALPAAHSRPAACPPRPEPAFFALSASASSYLLRTPSSARYADSRARLDLVLRLASRP